MLCLLSICNTTTIVTHTWQLHHSSHGNCYFTYTIPKYSTCHVSPLTFLHFLTWQQYKMINCNVAPYTGQFCNFFAFTLHIQVLVILDGNINTTHMAIFNHPAWQHHQTSHGNFSPSH